MPSRATAQTRARRAAVSRGVRALRVCVLFVTLMTVCGSAWSFWASIGGGSGAATTNTLAAPTGVSGTVPAGGTNVSVTWATASTGVAAAGYVVVRTSTTSGDESPACGSSASSPVTVSSCTDSSVPDGMYRYTVVAVRSGWTATSAPSGVVTVHLAIATTTTVSTTPNPAIVGQTITYTASVVSSSGQGTPSGTVIFRDAGTAIACTSGSQTLDASGVASCRVAYASAGTHEVTAAYAGSGAWAASTSAPVTQVVNRQSQTVTFTSTAPTNATVGGSSYTVSATATSGLAVTFSTSTTAVCTVSGTTVSYVAAGTCTVLASQSGNATYEAATPKAQSFEVAGAPTAPANLVVVPALGTALATWTSVSGYTYECQLTSGNSSPVVTGWVACTSPQSVTTKSGNQTFWVRSARGGAVSAPSSRNFAG
jgi:hypothetical protein